MKNLCLLFFLTVYGLTAYSQEGYSIAKEEKRAKALVIKNQIRSSTYYSISLNGGQPVKDSIISSHSEYDRFGNLISFTAYNQGRFSYAWKWEYDLKNFVIKYRYFSSDTFEVKYDNIYDKEDNLIQSRIQRPNYSYMVFNEYDSCGNLLMEKKCFEKNTLISRYWYGKDQNLIRSRRYKDGRLYHKGYFKYDTAGNKIEFNYKDLLIEDDNKGGKLVRNRVKGKIIWRYHLDNLYMQEVGDETQFYKYDEQNNEIEARHSYKYMTGYIYRSYYEYW
jgi:hypothetical protein